MTVGHILIVDDDSALLHALPEALRLRLPALQVETCDAAPKALQRIAEVDFDAIVSDIKMPGMDGLALLHEIRAIRPRTPTLLITGHGEHDLAVAALRGGAYDFIQKPIDRDYFVASLTRAIEVRMLSRQVEEQRMALEQHAASLEQIVAERTRELVVANRAKDELLRERDAALAEASAATERLRSLQRISDTALTHLDMQNLLSELLARISGAFMADTVAIMLLNEDGDVLSVRAACGLEADAAARSVQIPLGYGFAGRIASERRPLMINDVSQFEGIRPFLRERVRSLVGAPLLVDGRVIGVIHCGTVSAREFTTDDAQFLLLVADRIALAIDHARLYQDAQEATREHFEARKRVEELALQLGHRASELDAIIDAMADGVVVCDTDAQITRVNKAGYILLGWPIAAGERSVAAHGQQIAARYPDGDLIPSEEYPLIRALRGETGNDYLIAITRRDTGCEVRLRFSYAPIRDQHGAITGAVTVSRDVTALDQLERQKDEFLSIASHELKTPLTSLKGLTQITRRRLERAGIQEAVHLAGIERAIGRMEVLVNDLLDISRIESGKLALRIEHEDLTALCRQVADEQRAATNRELIVDVPSDLVELPMDADRIGQVLTNLLSNAFKYSPAEQPVTLRFEPADDEVRLAIIDNGPGIPEEQVPHLFERFYRVPGIDVQTGSGVGLGLGLYISHEIMERHGGRLWVENNPGGGATFRLALPCATLSSSRHRVLEHGGSVQF